MTTPAALSRCLPAPRRSAAVSAGSAAARACANGRPNSPKAPLAGQRPKHFPATLKPWKGTGDEPGASRAPPPVASPNELRPGRGAGKSSIHANGFIIAPTGSRHQTRNRSSPLEVAAHESHESHQFFCLFPIRDIRVIRGQNFAPAAARACANCRTNSPKAPLAGQRP